MASDTYSDGEGEFDGDDINENSPPSLSQEKGNQNKRKFESKSPPSPEISQEKGPEMIRLESIKAKINRAKKDDGGWDDPYTLELETLLSKSIRVNLDCAIRKITHFGYTKQVAESVVLRCGPFNGTSDMISHIVDSALTCLKNEHKEEDTSKFNIFHDLQMLVNYMLLEMVSIVREIKPYLSVAETMWTLLIHDLNIYQALDAETDRQQGEGSSTKTPSQSKFQNQETIASDVNKPDSLKPSNFNPQSSKSEDKNLDLRQKSFHFDKTCKGRISKGALKTKIYGRSGMVFDRRQKPPFDVSSAKKKSPTSPSKDTHPAPVPVPVPVPVPDPISSSSSSAPKIMPNEKAKDAEKYSVDSCLATIPYDEVQGYMPRDKQDKTMLVAAARIECLKKEHTHWDEWANRKVMDATKRLGHEQAELKTLRKERAETEKLKKDKQILEENTMKRLSEMTCALNSATCQIEVANSAVGRLQYDNSLIRVQMEAAKSQSSIEAKKLEQAMVNEQEASKKCQFIGPHKEILQEELKRLKLLVAAKQQEVDKGKSVLAQVTAKGASVESEKAKILKQAESIRRERERLEALAEAEEKRTTENAEKESKKYVDKIKQIEYEISALKLETETKKIAAMRQGMNLQPPKGTKRSEITRNNESVKPKRDRECVMCLTEEKAVIFLPCAHQVLCANCNEIHEKKGMNDCPSCRAPIEERFHARFRP